MSSLRLVSLKEKYFSPQTTGEGRLEDGQEKRPFACLSPGVWRVRGKRHGKGEGKEESPHGEIWPTLKWHELLEDLRTLPIYPFW